MNHNSLETTVRNHEQTMHCSIKSRELVKAFVDRFEEQTDSDDDI